MALKKALKKITKKEPVGVIVPHEVIEEIKSEGFTCLNCNASGLKCSECGCEG